MATTSPADKGRRTRIVNEAIMLTTQKAEIEKRLKAIKDDLGCHLDEDLADSKSVTLPTQKGVCEVTRVETLTIPERSVEGLQKALADRFAELVAAVTTHKVTPALKRIIEAPGPQEQDLSVGVAPFVERKATLRYTFRSA